MEVIEFPIDELVDGDFGKGLASMKSLVEAKPKG